ncbi:MAG: hypothetical protein ABJB33_05090, partial [Gemmatimonadota bacterium]
QCRNLYVLVLHRPGTRGTISERLVARHPWQPLEPGALLRVAGRKARVASLASHIERHGDDIEHVTHVYTHPRTRLPRRPSRRRELAANVVLMPPGDASEVAEFLRYHVLVRVFDGDPDAWLDRLRGEGSEEGDARFVRWIRTRLRRDPALLTSIRAMVDATPFWIAVAGCQ